MGRKPKRKPRSPKGSVTVESFRGRLRLRLPRQVFGGALKYLSLYLPDTPENRQVAMAKAKIIEADIALERFDPTLQRYKSPYASDDSPPLIELWQKYTEWKAPHISPSTLNKDFKKTANHIRRLPTQRISQARLIRDWLGNNLSPNVAKKCLMWIKGCTRWACEEGIIAVDPFAGMTIRSPVKKEKRDRREPFTPGEKQQILAAFDDRHPHYGPYVRFLFLTGYRTSEANGL